MTPTEQQIRSALAGIEDIRERLESVGKAYINIFPTDANSWHDLVGFHANVTDDTITLNYFDYDDGDSVAAVVVPLRYLWSESYVADMLADKDEYKRLKAVELEAKQKRDAETRAEKERAEYARLKRIYGK